MFGDAPRGVRPSVLGFWVFQLLLFLPSARSIGTMMRSFLLVSTNRSCRRDAHLTARDFVRALRTMALSHYLLRPCIGKYGYD